jgi:hypothetical protein
MKAIKPPQTGSPPGVCEITSPANGSSAPAGSMITVQGNVKSSASSSVSVNAIYIDGSGNQSPPINYPATVTGTAWTVNIPLPNDGVTVSVCFVLVTADQTCTDAVTISLT